MIYRVVTYDKQTERIRGAFIVPPSALAAVKRIAGFQPEDDGLGEYPLDEQQTWQVASILDFNPEPDGFYYYVEPYESPEDDGLQQPQAAAR